VQIVLDTELIQFEGWTIRVKKSTHPAPRLLLMIHGLTGDENSMWVFARDLPSHYWIIAPRAPYPAQPFGYSWRSKQVDLEYSTYEQLLPNAGALIELVEAYQAAVKIEAQVFDIMGFSQGAAMSSVLTFLHPDRIRKTGLLAGFVPNGLEALTHTQPLRGKPFFVAHGTKDETIPVEQARTSVKLLEQAGANMTYCEDEVGHKVSLPCLRALREFLKA